MRNNFKKERLVLSVAVSIHLEYVKGREGHTVLCSSLLDFGHDGPYSKPDTKQGNEDRMSNYMQVHRKLH